jgi:hypothetical protein
LLGPVPGGERVECNRLTGSLSIHHAADGYRNLENWSSVSDDSAFAPEDVLSDVVIALGLPIVRTRPGCANFFELVCQALSYDFKATA